MKLTRGLLEDVLGEAGVEEEPRWDYSGRYMYGKTCFGFVGDVRDLAAFFYQLACVDGDDDVIFYDLHRALCTDSMGLNTIFYFPGVDVSRDEEEPEADEPDPDAERDARLDVDLGVV
jgi:hypothetical protein